MKVFNPQKLPPPEYFESSERHRLGRSRFIRLTMLHLQSTFQMSEKTSNISIKSNFHYDIKNGAPQVEISMHN